MMIEIRLPYDPIVTVLRFETIRVAFSWAGIQQQQIDQLSLLGPTVYIGDDLFWFVDRLKTAAQEAAPAAPAPRGPSVISASWADGSSSPPSAIPA
ncbi:MAG: hypothetical protein HC901_04455 [Bdellovibrionaceae bacterium]|nr:hypothetical protein [Pseudobdellovibrionaceae bacterium]